MFAPPPKKSQIPTRIHQRVLKDSSKNQCSGVPYGRVSMLQQLKWWDLSRSYWAGGRKFVQSFYLVTSSKDRGQGCPKAHRQVPYLETNHNKTLSNSDLLCLYIYICLRFIFSFLKKAALKLIRHRPTMH